MRVIDIAQKIHLKENKHIRERLPEWIEKSIDYADMMIERYGFNDVQDTKEGYRLLFILNHVCPGLYHFHKIPTWRPRCEEDMKEYNELIKLHTMENSQAGFSEDGIILQEGVGYSKEEFEAFMNAVQDAIA